MLCDLHTHSIFSDGTSTPEELIDLAVDAGLGAIALTDHNTIDGLEDFASAASGKSIDIALGCEFSVDYGSRELHLIGMFILEKHFSQISDLMADMRARKQEQNIALVEALNRAGISVDYNEILGKTPDGNVNRAHIAYAMMQRGYVSSIAEAFETYLSPSAGYYKAPRRISVWEMLDVIRAIGAVSVLAHPFLKLSKSELLAFLPKAKDVGLNAIECAYSLNNELITSVSEQIAEDFGLLKSGGSDFHGLHKPDISIGIGKGNLQVPYEWYLKLKEKAF